MSDGGVFKKFDQICYEFGERRNWHHNVFWQKMILNISQQMWVHWIVGNHIYVQNSRDYSSTHNSDKIVCTSTNFTKLSFFSMIKIILLMKV